jgi:very-short-patch-repair endonuclease
VIGSFIVDFFCSEARLVVEIDGEIHDGLGAQQHDADREATLNALGFSVLRFTNRQTLEERDSAVATIQAWVSA